VKSQNGYRLASHTPSDIIRGLKIIRSRSAGAGLYCVASMTGQTQGTEFKPMGRAAQKLALVLLLLLYLLVALAHAYLAPLTTGPDELAHYEYVRFIAEHGRLPQNYAEREQASYKSDQPPLYYLITALPASLVDPTGPPFLKRVIDHPRRQLIERTRHAWGLYNTEDEMWPYRAEVLRWHVGRWVAIFFGAATVVVTFFIARDVFIKLLPSPWRGREPCPKERGEGVLPALGAAAIVAFIPRFALTGSMLNYETTQAFFAALFLWVLLRLGLSASGRQVWWNFVLLGLFMGLAITAKLSAIILPLEMLLALWLIKKQTSGITWPRWLQNVLITLATTGVVIGFWFGFILYHFNTVAKDGWWVGLLRPLIAADPSDATTNRLLSALTSGEAGFTGAIENLDSGPPWEWLSIFFRTFWVVGIEGHQPLGWLGLGLALLLCLLAAYGLVTFWRQDDHQPLFTDRRSEDGDSRLILLLLLLHLVAPLILPLVRYAVTFSLADTAQGRHVLFMAAPAFAILLVWGISEAVSRLTSHVSHLTSHVSRFISLIPGLFLLTWSCVQLWYMTWAYNPLLPVRTMPEARTQAVHQLNQPLNDYVTLVGYDSQLDDNQMMRLDLIWQATAISPFDYLTEVSLLDEEGSVQVQWLGYPANGRYPTRAWDVGDVVRDTVWLPLIGLAPGPYQVNLQLISTNLNPPLKSASPQLVSPLSLTTITLKNLSPPPNDDFQVWQNGEALTGPKTFRYRETILVTLNPTLSDQQRTVQIVGPAASQSFAPVREVNNTALFIIGPDWTTGDYRFQVTSKEPGQSDEQQLVSEPMIHLIDRWERQFTQPPMQHLVEANFANQVKLLGYDLDANRTEPGGGIPITLYWQGLDWLGHDYTIFAKLLSTIDQTVHGGRERLPREGYSTLYWAPGEIVTDPFGVPVAADAPNGVYHINVGLYKAVNQQAVSLPLVQDGQLIDASSVNIGPIKIGGALPGLTLETAHPQNPLNQPFGDVLNLTLLGYDLTIQDSHLKLTLYWRSEAPLSIDYTTFVHLRNAANEIVAQQDQPPLNGAYPTSLWDPGEMIADEIIIPRPGDLPAGEYQLVVGMYDFHTSQRLTVPDNPANEVRLTDVEIR
jgi:4-amino-4-deoxy-L-arabinose transferase-like glycosyltransferase